MYPLIKIISIIVVVLIGIMMNNEKADILTIIGIILGCTSIYLLNIEKK